jgi:hypothetical protein
MKKKLVWDPNSQLVWEDGIPREAGKAVAEQKKLLIMEEVPDSSAGTREHTEPLISTKRTRDPVSYEGMASSGTPLKSTKRTRDPVSYKGMTSSGTPLKSIKRKKAEPEQATATRKEEAMAELAAVLRSLAVVGEEKLARRERSGSRNETPTRISNPIPKPNATEQALWDLTLSKVRGIAE